MPRVLSHIIQKRFSQVNEDVATDALAYIVGSSESASKGMRKLLCGLVPDLPKLQFRTQEADGSIRPDMWGYEGSVPRVFIENKFWAGLTDNQPVNYLKQLAAYSKSGILLVVAPHARQHTLWPELERRLGEEEIVLEHQFDAPGIEYAARSSLGPILALTSWDKVLAVLEHEASEDPEVRGDLMQLRSLCEAADTDAFSPVSRERLSDQMTPAFILQMNSLWQEVVERGSAGGILDTKGLMPQANGERTGRYVKFGGLTEETQHIGGWFGTHFVLWKKHGASPLWFVCNKALTEGADTLLEQWAAQNKIVTARENGRFAVALDLPPRQERDAVVRSVLERLSEMRQCWIER